MSGGRPVLIAGPTASGKSGLAVALAERLGGMVINADSQQVYAGWRILSARPSEAEMARAEHRLFGHVAMDADYSVGRWLADLAQVLEDCRARGLRPIIAGGTGLYFKALTQGLAEIPPIPQAVRKAGEARLEAAGLAEFAAELSRRDPETFAALDPANPVRVLRAWEVLEATGRGLAAWKRETPPPLLPLAEVATLRIEPEREALYAACEARLDAMVAGGVLEEVAAVRAMGLDPESPAMKAVGAPEFMAHLAGEIPLDEAVAKAKLATRRYAKRQLTWARQQMADWQVLAGPDLEAALACLREPGP